MTMIVDIGGKGCHEVSLVRGETVTRIEIDGVAHLAQLSSRSDGSHELSLDGKDSTCWVLQHGDTALVHAFGRSWSVHLHDPIADSGDQLDVSDICVAPMPCTVVDLKVAVGDEVCSGQTLVVIESMKMQMNLEAARDGVIAEVKCAKGEVFDRDALLVRLAPKEA